MQADEQPESKAETTIDLKVAEALERWEKAVANGKTPDPLQIAAGDSDLAQQIIDLTRVLTKFDQSGFNAIDHSKLADLVGDDVIANEIAIPDFEWLSELGRGGMGVVYEARQLSLNRIVAVKLQPLGTLDRQAARRFEREATTASSLQHPHIVPIYAAGQAAGTHWYAMQKIDGQSLAEMIYCNPKGIDWKRTVEIGIQVAEALVHAHQKGVVHRDIKPGNLLEDRTGHIWLTDFGLARSDADATATLSHAMMGTPRYMSPEQIDGNRETDPRTDLYGLGATLYELATGTPLYSGSFPLDVIQKIRVDDPERPSKINPLIPRSLEVVIQRCLEKSPRDRYATAADFLSDLKSIQAGQPIQASGLSIWTSWHRKGIRYGSRIRLAATAALISIVMAAAGVMLYQSYRAGRMSSLRIGSVGGPYMARIQSFDANKQPSPLLPQIMRAALPIDQGIALESGQYEVSFSSRGRFSERAVVQLPAGSGIDAQYIDRRPSPATIDVEGKWLEVIEAHDGSRKTFLAILDDENLVIYDKSHEKFTLKLSDIAGVIEPDLPSTSYLFGRGLESSLHGNRHARNPFFAKVHPVMPTAVDLDGDSLLDFVVSARTEPVVAAVSSDGKRLWTARADVALPDNPTAPYQAPDKSLIPYPSVRQILSVVDHNEDGTSDLLINTIATRNGATYAQLTLLSGRDGTRIWTEPLPVMTPTNGTRWPLDGLLNNFAWITKRQPQRLFHSSNGLPITNITVSPQFDVHWGHFMQARVPVTPPIAIVNIQEKQFAAIAIDNSTVRCIDMKTGKWAEDSMSDTKPFCLAPRRVRLGKGESDGLLALRLVAPTAMGSGGLEQLSVCSLKDSKILWSNDLNLRLEYIANKQERSDFPLIADLDHDGVDEIIVAHSNAHMDTVKAIDCLDAKTGNSRWRRPHSIACMEVIPERACVVGDLDADGCDDLAIATLFGESEVTASMKAQSDISLFVDCVSGQTGKQIRLLREAVTDASRIDDLISIDSIRVVGNHVEVAVVWGKLENRLLDSRTVRFSLVNQSIPQMAEGVTPLATFNSESGYYLQRPGPMESQRALVSWIEPTPERTLFCGMQSVYISWSDSSGKHHSARTIRKAGFLRT